MLRVTASIGFALALPMEQPSPMTKHARASRAFNRIPLMKAFLREDCWFKACVCFSLFSHAYANYAIEAQPGWHPARVFQHESNVTLQWLICLDSMGGLGRPWQEARFFLLICHPNREGFTANQIANLFIAYASWIFDNNWFFVLAQKSSVLTWCIRHRPR